MLITDTKGTVQYINRRFSEVTGYALEEVVGKTPSLLKSGQTPEHVYREMWAALRAGQTWEGRVINRRKPALPVRVHGADPHDRPDLYWSQLSIAPVRDEVGEVTGYIATHQDVTQQVQLENQIDFERKEAKVRAEVSALLQTQAPLRDRLDQALGKLMTLGELEVQNKAGVFISDPQSRVLDMFVMRGEFTAEFIEKEKQVAFGACLCGRAAVSGEMLVSDDCFCDDRHDHTFVGMTNHGHYIVPLRAGGETLGIMFLYTDPYPSKDPARLATLEAIGDAMALAIANDRIEQQHVKAEQAALEASESKSRFLANMSHEIRTPLNGIIGFTDLLRRGDAQTDPLEQQEWLDIIHRSGRHLLQLINDILDLSKVEADQLDVEKIQCNLPGTVSELASVLRLRAREKGLSFDVAYAGPVPASITTDPTRLRQVLTNLLSNAIKFTQSGQVTTTVRLVTDATPEPMIEFEIIDTGPGVPQDKLETIFDPFTQADSSVTRKFGGTGLGLAISKRFAEALGGSLTVRSEVGVGSTFTLRIAAGAVDADQLVDASSAEAIQKKKQAPDFPASSAPRLSGRVLLVDDGATNRRLIELILGRVGVDVTSACNGREGVELAKAQPFDLVLLDMQMPVMDGYTAAAAMRKAGVEVPIFALTANAMQEDRDRCLAAGCTDYLTKPIDAEKLIHTVSEHLGVESSATNEGASSGASSSARSETSALISTLPLDDPEFQEIVVEFAQTLATKLGAMQKAWEQQDTDALVMLAHWLRGSGGMAGFDAFTHPAGHLEKLARQGLWEQAHPVLENLAEISNRMETSPPTADETISGL